MDQPVPQKKISMTDAVLLIVGMVVGAGIFRAPSLVAANTGTDSLFYLTWVIGGIVSLVGALCYAELSATFPSTGGDYHFLQRAYGSRPAFLFAWARLSVIQTGSIAMLSYIFGDYMSQVYDLGPNSSFIYAAGVIISLTLINILGLRFGTGTQRVFTFTEIAGVLLVSVVGLFFTSGEASLAASTTQHVPLSATGMAMVFVLLTFGGWNEAAYLSAELKSGPGAMARVLMISISVITVLYLLINLAYIHVLGHGGLANSSAAAADLMKQAWGTQGTAIIGLLVAVSALTSANATIFTGARTNYALGKDVRIFSLLGQWNGKTSAPVNAFIAQGIIALLLISMGLITRSGFETIIEYTAPVFWLFFLLTGLSVFILRVKEPHITRPFRVPLYPVLPFLFCISSAYLLYSSVTYTGLGAFVGVAVLAIGVVILVFADVTEQPERNQHTSIKHQNHEKNS